MTISIPAATTLPIRRLRFPTLLVVELRKLTDTRSARGLLAATVAASVGVLAWKVGHPGVETSFDNYSRAVATFVAFLTPLIGLLAMTSEWTQRTALTTFTLAPRRLPVIAAKYVAALGLSLAVLAVGLVMAALATGIGGAVHGAATFGGVLGVLGDVRGALIFVALQVTMAAAFGVLVANTPVALVAFLLAPTVWTMLAQGVLRGVAPWFDIFAAYDRLASGHPFAQPAHTLTALSVWVVVPAVIGVVRGLRREVK